jgi:enoyl-CoA hydratase/carnithine racemase
MSEPSVIFETRPLSGGRYLGVARLNRPRQLNALNLEMCERLVSQLREWASDESVVAVMIEGAGDKSFCAGGDVAEVVRQIRSFGDVAGADGQIRPGGDVAGADGQIRPAGDVTGADGQIRSGGPRRFVYGDAFFAVEYQLDAMIHEYPKPVIAWVHGVCMGGGVGLMVGASHRIVTEGVRIAMPEIHIGLFPDVGGGWFLNRVPNAAGRVMALAALAINEADALHAGLADWFVPRELQEDFHEALTGLEWSGDASADRMRLTRLCASFHRKARAGLPESPLRQYADALRFIGMQPDAAGVRDALAAAAQEDPWFEAPAEAIRRGSPVGACVSFEYLNRTRAMSIREVLALDLVLARQFQRHPDFPEGVRALLIDKDRKPVWSVACIEDVSGELLAAHFA